jgi:excisionase
VPQAKIKEVVYRTANEDEIATHGDYKHLCQRWEGLTVHTAKQFAKEMRENPEFEQYVFNPTHKLVFIDYEGFRKFWRWKQLNRYRSKKISLADMESDKALAKRLGF